MLSGHFIITVHVVITFYGRTLLQNKDNWCNICVEYGISIVDCLVSLLALPLLVVQPIVHNVRDTANSS